MRVLLVDDDAVVTMSLKMILEASGEVEVTGIGNDGEDAVTLYSQTKPDVLLMDIRMSRMNGLEAARAVLKENPAAVILLLTTFSDDEYILEALKLGVKGYILKQDFESILPALRAVCSGQSVFGRDVVSKLPEMMTREQKQDFSDSGLSEKELQVATEVADGRNNKEIAEILFLSEGTVRNYISTILEKLELRDRTQLAIWYLKRGN